MFNCHEKSVVGSTNHKRVHTRVRGCAGPFSTNVDENWAIIFIPELIIHPVALLVGFINLQVGVNALIQVVVDLVGKPLLAEVCHHNSLQLFSCGNRKH